MIGISGGGSSRRPRSIQDCRARGRRRTFTQDVVISLEKLIELPNSELLIVIVTSVAPICRPFTADFRRAGRNPARTKSTHNFQSITNPNSRNN
jgi:hypothetical protein